MKKFLIVLLLLYPSMAFACACGCGVFDVGTSSMFPEGKGGTFSLEYDYMNQKQNWHGTSSAPSADNDDKDIRSHFYTAGIQYMFNRDWGIRASLPYWDRSFTADDGGIQSFRHSAWGDAKLLGIYTGFSPDLSSGLLFGAKLPTGDYTYQNFDRDTAIGTGSTDLLFGGYHMDRLTKKGDWSWFAQIMFDVPVLTRGGYRPGAELDAAAGVYYEGWRPAPRLRVSPVVQLIAVDRLHDTGPAAEPENSGYRRLLAAPGLEFDFGKTKIYGDVEVPLYQDVRGEQLAARTLYKVVASYKF